MQYVKNTLFGLALLSSTLSAAAPAPTLWGKTFGACGRRSSALVQGGVAYAKDLAAIKAFRSLLPEQQNVVHWMVNNLPDAMISVASSKAVRIAILCVIIDAATKTISPACAEHGLLDAKTEEQLRACLADLQQRFHKPR